jgi:hypothetical protein
MSAKLTRLLRRLMPSGGGETADQEGTEGVEYKGYTIRPTPRRQGAQWLTAGVITRRFEDETREQQFIRADTHASRDDADACAIAKAKRIIDEQGDGLFHKR